MAKTKNGELLKDFIEYCMRHPGERFWQALRNWSGADAIQFIRGLWDIDTFYWEKKDEFVKSIDEE